MEIKIAYSQKQTTQVTHLLIQSVEILQLSSQNLAEYIYNEAMENPVIDMEAIHMSELRNKIDWLRRNDHSISTSHVVEDDDEKSDIDCWGKSENVNSLQKHLRAQIADFRLSEKEEQIINYLIACVDSKGYLDEDVQQTAAIFDVEPKCIEFCLGILRSMSPVGVCAKNLQHCLELQIQQFPEEKVALAIIRGHLDSLAKGRYLNIAKQLNVSQNEVRKAAQRIKQLNPIPAAGFESDNITVYIFPDAQIVLKDGRAEAELCASFIPQVRIDGYYNELYDSTSDEALKNYLDSKMKSAQWLIKCVSQREKTLLDCLDVICDIQQEYLSGRIQHIAPMTLADVAERMGVHVSTVSRAVRNKYLQCSYGVIPLKDLFSRNLGCEDREVRSSAEAKNLILEYVKSEDKKKPLSDQQLAKLLNEEGLSVSRRTVAKYREQLEIPSTLLRKSQ